MVRDHGFRVLGAPDEGALDGPHDPAKRRRGAGTEVAPNA
jgi:biotin synthase